jgi:hypothetical protein
MKVLEALVFLFKGMLFLDGHVTRDFPSPSDRCHQ